MRERRRMRERPMMRERCASDGARVGERAMLAYPGCGRAGASHRCPAGPSRTDTSVALKDYLRISTLSERDLTTLLDLSEEVKAQPHRYADLLRDEVVAMSFTKPSTRTRVSFTVAISRLGATPEMLGAGDLQQIGRAHV